MSINVKKLERQFNIYTCRDDSGKDSMAAYVPRKTSIKVLDEKIFGINNCNLNKDGTLNVNLDEWIMLETTDNIVHLISRNLSVKVADFIVDILEEYLEEDMPSVELVDIEKHLNN